VKVRDDQDETIGDYWYDGDGRRVKKHVPSTGEVTVFVYDAGGKMVGEYSTIVETQSPKVSYTTADHLGSPRINTDANGSVTARHDYHPFGEEIYTSQRTQALGYTADTIRKQFTGYERDSETDLDHTHLRMYSNRLGRFLTADPVAPDIYTPATHNRYQYCLNNPYRFIDSDGGYDRDVHVDLTAMMALAVGFSQQQADIIANSNQWLDDPSSPWNPEQVGAQGVKARKLFHFTDQATRWAHWKSFEDQVMAGSADAFAALGTFMHPQQDSFSHRGFEAVLGQVPGGLDNLNLFTSPRSMVTEARKYDRTSYRPKLAEEMARDTFSRLLQARNMMAKRGRFGSFREPVPYSAIESKVSEWVRANSKQKKVILGQIRNIIMTFGQNNEERKKKKTKTTVKVIEEE